MRKPISAVAAIAAVLAVSNSIVTNAANGNAPDTQHASRPVAAGFQVAMMDMMPMMPMMEKPKGGMSAMPSDTPMTDPMAAPASMEMMGRMRGPMKGKPAMSNMAPASSLPGFPGASHLYHIGATDFFLDHPQHITLSIEQQTALNRIKEKSLLDRASSDRRIEEAEQELWLLTSSDSPDAAKIETQVRAIEKHRGDQRLAFIREVGAAGKILTADQRPALLGTKPAPGSKPPAAVNKPAPMPRM